MASPLTLIHGSLTLRQHTSDYWNSQQPQVFWSSPTTHFSELTDPWKWNSWLEWAKSVIDLFLFRVERKRLKLWRPNQWSLKKEYNALSQMLLVPRFLWCRINHLLTIYKQSLINPEVGEPYLYYSMLKKLHNQSLMKYFFTNSEKIGAKKGTNFDFKILEFFLRDGVTW